MNERCRELLYIIFLAAMVVAPTASSRCFAASGNTSPGNASLKQLIVEEAAGGTEATRKKMMLDYATSVNPGSEFSLREFREGDETVVSRAAGRGKAALVLHLLRRVAGEEVFGRAVGKISAAPASQSWDDIRMLFEKETGKDLGWFFQQWVDRKGLPDLRMEKVSVRRSGSKFEVSFDLLQKGEVYTLDIPVSISFVRGGGKADTVRLDAGKKRVSLLFDEEPAAIEIDREYDIPRIPTAAETPPILAKILSEEKPFLVPPEHGAELYAGVISAWKERGAEERRAAALKDSEVSASSFIVLGENNPFIGRLYGGGGAGGAGELRLAARKNPWNPDKVVVLVEAKSVHAADETMRALQESEVCSSLTVLDRGRVSQETEASERGIRMDLREEPTAIDVSAVKTLSHVIEGAAGKKIVYVGEHHDRFAHHQVQVEVIKSMYRKDPKLAIGMEMFQRPFQPVLDDYINGVIEEREFLKKTEYYQRWSFDYNLYKPILDFARAGKIPVVALNLRRELVEKVSKSGMETLTGDERKEIPAETDFSDADYRDRLQQVFSKHKGGGARNFDYFYQAQILWDETMAMSIDEYLKKDPGRRMVVIAGEGHLAYGSGIPKRAFRRNGYEYAVILNDADVERDIADYLVYPQALEGVTAPRLMVALTESDGKVIITDLPKDSVAWKAGLKTGDTIVSIDGAPVRTVADVKLELFYKKPADEIRIKAVRRRFLLGEKDMEFVVKLR